MVVKPDSTCAGSWQARRCALPRRPPPCSLCLGAVPPRLRHPVRRGMHHPRGRASGVRASRIRIPAPDARSRTDACRRPPPATTDSAPASAPPIFAAERAATCSRKRAAPSGCATAPSSGRARRSRGKFGEAVRLQVLRAETLQRQLQLHALSTKRCSIFSGSSDRTRRPRRPP